MAVPATRETLKQYSLRALGKPVIEINVDDDQLEDRIDEALQYFAQYHYDGVERMYLKYKISQADIDRGTGKNTDGVGIVTTTASSPVVSGLGTVTSNWYETSNFLEVPDSVRTESGTSKKLDVSYQLEVTVPKPLTTGELAVVVTIPTPSVFFPVPLSISA